jgi:hypothetical protein
MRAHHSPSDNIIGRRALQSPEFFIDRGLGRLLIVKQCRLSAHRIGKHAMQRRCVAAGAAQPVNTGGGRNGRFL